MKLQYSVFRRLVSICKLFGVTRQAYYKKQTRKVKLILHHEIVIQMVEKQRELPQWKKMGTEKLYLRLKPEFEKLHIKMGRISLHRLVKEYGLLVRQKRKRAITTDSYHRFTKHPNLIQGLELLSAGVVWVSDITYLSLTDRFAYLFLITDAYSHKIIGYTLSLTLAAKGAIDAFNMAMAQYNYVKYKILIHHSDRGIQYACDPYVQLLEKHRVKISMSAKASPYQNPIAERINGILKNEMGLDRQFDNFEQATEEVIRTIEMYNNQRSHRSIDMLTPAVAHTMTGLISKRWK